MVPNNTTHLPDDVFKEIQERSEDMLLASILLNPLQAAPAPSNTRPYRQWNAAMKCVETLLATTSPTHTALVTLTTSCKAAKRANPKLSKILGKVLAPHCTQWIRFFHRTKNGFVHWHLIVALNFPVLNTDHESWTDGERIRRSMRMENCPHEDELEMNKVLSDRTRALAKHCRGALGKAGIGYYARIEPIICPERIGAYCGRYLARIAASRRISKDRKLRLWSASKSARVANAEVTVISRWSRISRLRRAAYCASQGWRSMEEARKSNPKWNWHSRAFLLGKKLRLYLHESDYVSEWGNCWSPCASGVRILYPHVRPGNGMVFQYVHNERPTDVNDLAALQREWDEALPVPLDIWFGKNQ